MRKNVGQQDANWRIGTGIFALLWASRRKAGRMAKAAAGLYGLVALAEGITRYDPLMEALGCSTNDEEGNCSPPSCVKSDIADVGAAIGRTIFQLGNLVSQHMPRRQPRSMWGVAQGVTIAPESNNWKWDELDDAE